MIGNVVVVGVPTMSVVVHRLAVWRIEQRVMCRRRARVKE